MRLPLNDPVDEWSGEVAVLCFGRGNVYKMFVMCTPHPSTLPVHVSDLLLAYESAFDILFGFNLFIIL